jgi:hypothetical protein
MLIYHDLLYNIFLSDELIRSTLIYLLICVLQEWLNVQAIYLLIYLSWREEVIKVEPEEPGKDKVRTWGGNKGGTWGSLAETKLDTIFKVRYCLHLAPFIFSTATEGHNFWIAM